MQQQEETRLTATGTVQGDISQYFIPDRVSLERNSPFFWPNYKRLGVMIEGERRPGDVVEFCVSEGWALVQLKDRYGRKMVDPENPGRYQLHRIEGKIEPYWINKEKRRASPTDVDRITAAEAKRRRKAAALAARGRL